MRKQNFKKFLPTKEKILDYQYRRHFIVFCLSMLAFIACTVFGLIDIFTFEGIKVTYGYIELGFALIALVNGFAGGFFYKVISAVEIVFYLFVVAILLFILFTGAASPSSLFWVMLLPCCVYMFCTFKMASIINSFMIVIVVLMFWCPPIRDLAPWLKEMNQTNRDLIIRFPLIYLGSTGLGVLFSVVFGLVSKENHRLLKKFTKSAETDFLTQLKNRYWLAREFKHHTDVLTPDDVVNVIFIDIDDFKQFNDNYGHSFGDVVLIEVANTLKGLCGDEVVRLGGDEFVYITINKSPRELRNLSEKIRISVDELQFEEPKDANVTVSIGVASLKADQDFNFDKVIAIADNQQSLAKQGGKNRVFQIELTKSE